MTAVCAADKTVGGRRCSKRGRYAAVQVQPTVDIPAPADELVCHWHADHVVPARRPDPACCEACGRPR